MVIIEGCNGEHDHVRGLVEHCVHLFDGSFCRATSDSLHALQGTQQPSNQRLTRRTKTEWVTATVEVELAIQSSKVQRTENSVKSGFVCSQITSSALSSSGGFVSRSRLVATMRMGICSRKRREGFDERRPANKRE
jgi:hypothetical protein